MDNGSDNLNMARPDVALLLDREGIIRKVTVASSFAAAGNMEDLVGRPWVETVRDVGDEKVRRMVEEATRGGVSAFRQFTQCFPNGLELPMEFTTVQLGNDGSLLAVGKNLQAVAELQSRLVTAQQAMEREYWKLRYLEARYRLLLDASKEPVLLVKASNLRIVEANPSASRALGVATGNGSTIEESELLDLVQTTERKSLESMLVRVRDQGKAPAMLLHLGQDHRPWFVQASLVTSEQGLVFLLQLTPAGSAAIEPDDSLQFKQLVESTPDALLMIDAQGRIIKANPAFMDLVQVRSESSLEGQMLARWMGRPGADLKVLLANLFQHGVVRLFSTTMQSELGIPTEVEISAVGDRPAKPQRIGLIIRDVGSRLPPPQQGDKDLGSRLGSLSKQIGHSPLRKLVKDTVGVVESHYIEAALELTEGNRTAAAEVLGISRQSLYAKLNRYGLGNGSDLSNSDPDD